MKLINNPHDKFFKYIFNKKENIITLLKFIFQKNNINFIDFNNIKIISNEQNNKKFKHNFADIIIKTKIKNNINTDIYLIIEHKSYKDKNIFIQILEYMLNMWKQDIENKQKLRVIIPIVIYHGKNRWNIPVEFKDYFDVDNDIRKYLINYRYVLLNLREAELNYFEDSELKNNKDAYISLLLLKNAYENNIEILKKVTDYLVIKNDINEDIKLYKEKILFYYNYIIKTEEIEETELEKFFNENSIKEVNVPTLAQKWYQQGIEKGKMEGIEEGEIIKQQEILIRQLSKKFGLNEKEKELIKSIKDKEKLDKALDLILDANDKNEIFNLF